MDELKAFLLDVLKTPAFYTALMGLGHALLAYFAPNVPKDIILAVDSLIAVIAGVFTGKAIEAKRAAAHIAQLEAKLKAFGLKQP